MSEGPCGSEDPVDATLGDLRMIRHIPQDEPSPLLLRVSRTTVLAHECGVWSSQPLRFPYPQKLEFWNAQLLPLPCE
jgi:hypothetical protein